MLDYPENELLESEKRIYDLGVADERARCVRICRDHASGKTPPHRESEDNYRNGWLDAANECELAIKDLSDA